MSLGPKAFKEVLSHFASGVTVVTTRCDGVAYGLTVSAFTSVSVNPPRVLVCLGNETDSKPMIERAGHFAVHILGRHQAQLGLRFAKIGGEVKDPFEGLVHRAESTGSPVLADCLAWLDCRIDRTLVVGDHSVVIGAVEAAGSHGAQPDPVLYFRRAWRTLDPVVIEP